MADDAKIGTVITTEDSPSVAKFSFVVHQPVRRGEFVAVQTSSGLILANISNIYKTNKYFESAGAVKEYSSGSDLHTSFPVKDWEYTVAETSTLGVYDKKGMLERTSFPPSPGATVVPVDLKILNKFLGLDQAKGIHLGNVQQHDLDAKFNLTRMLQKHLAILAISGAGKSYATAVLIEELINRDPKSGRVALLAIDNHGEYKSFAQDPGFKDKVEIVEATQVRLNTAHMTEKGFAALLPNMSPQQVRELGKVLQELKAEKNPYDLNVVIDRVRESEIKSNTKDPLMGWLSELNSMNVFGKADFPSLSGILKQGKLVVFNFREILDLRRKQLIVNYISRRLFDMRRKGICPPYLEIIEEAHNFCPEGKRAEYSLSRGIIETLAREGRKFQANICLISQRPIQLSTTALSQCNTQIILRITNPYDLDHIRRSAEAISGSTVDVISSLKVGEALVVGEATNHPVFVKIRERKSKETHGKTLEEEAIEYEETAGKGLAEGKEFI